MTPRSSSPAVSAWLDSLPEDRRADDLAMDAIGDIVASTPVDRWVEIAESARRR